MDRYKARGASAASLTPRTFERAEPGSIRKAHPALRLCERKLLLVALDLAVLNAALLLVLTLHPRLSNSVHEAQLDPAWFIVLSIVWLVVGQIGRAHV